ncbi:hypothetical protein BDV93DRAFT_604691 [Ceratobasidium sp. AG-I]|nr:hypothetical protein BDV93DRAFT_604691 [Ceratobasidium sp. AG-I]
MAAPIDRLPPELLSRIFGILVLASRYADSIGDKSHNNIDYPLRLSSVCVRWRQVAIRTRLLWSFLDFARPSNGLRKLKYLNLYHERSANAPLSLRLGQHEGERCGKDVNEELFTLLGLCATHLYSVAVYYSHPSFAKEVLSLFLARGAAGRIRKLALDADEDDYLIIADSSLPQGTLDELLAPLHSLHLQCVSFEWDTICCRNLVELHLDRLDTDASPSSTQLVSFLNANPMICKLYVGELGPCTYGSGLPPIILSELQNLELDTHPEFAEWFLTLLTPGTQEITLRIYCYIAEPNEVLLSNAFRRFFQRARTVTLQIPGDNFIPFSGVAAYLPYLEILRIYTPICGYDLSRFDTQTELLPRLHTVELVGCTTRAVESGLGTVLSLPSIRQISLLHFYSVDETGSKTSMDIDQAEEWMCRQGVTANLSIAPELLFDSSQTPFW